VREALPEASVLKLGMVNPLPRTLIEEFAANVDRLYVVEELEPNIEEQVRSWGIKAIGKEILTVQGEYSANMLRQAIGGETTLMAPAADVPARPPILCPGCPHRSVFSVVSELGLHAAGDIGCYTLGTLSPLNVIDTTLCMGSSISTLHGMEKAKGREYIKNWVAFIGDSTFMHTGVNSLINMVYNQGTGTVIILDNSTTGMTGHQDHPATGKTLMGQTVPAVDIEQLCKTIGVPHVIVVDAFDTKALKQIIKEETQAEVVSVIIAQSPCALLKGQAPKPKCIINEEKCKKCGKCLKSGCPAMGKTAEGIATIDDTMCNGCGLCEQNCPFGAIERQGK
jgi:indolepyruvate ferredoxin oxidoreductase alpha subunit